MKVQLDSPVVTRMSEVLQHAKSSYLSRFSRLAQEIQDGSEQAERCALQRRNRSGDSCGWGGDVRYAGDSQLIVTTYSGASESAQDHPISPDVGRDRALSPPTRIF